MTDRHPHRTITSPGRAFRRGLRRSIIGTLALAGLLVSPARANDIEACNQSLTAPDTGIPACTRLLDQPRSAASAAGILNDRGVGKVARGDFQDAIADFTSALDREPNSVNAYRNRGIAWQMLSEFDKAIADFTRALKLSPKNEALFNARGSALLSKEEFGSAADDFSRAIALNRKFAPPFLNRGLANQSRRRLDSAIADFDEYIRLEPKDVRGLTNRAAARIDRADFDGAISDYSEAIRRDSNFAIAYSGRGEAYRLKTEYDRALADHDKAVALDATVDILINRALLQRSRGELEAARTDLDQAIVASPRNGLAYANRGIVQAELGDLKAAFNDLDKAVEFSPNSPVTLTFRGDVLRQAGRVAEALADYDRAIRKQPDFVAAYAGRGQAFERRSDKDAAHSDYEQALRLPVAFDYGLAKPAQDLARKRLAALDAERATLALRSAQAAADNETLKRSEAERLAKLATIERRKFEAEANARVEAERAARLDFEVKAKAEAKAEVAERMKAAQERMEAELRMKSAAAERDRADYAARVKAQAEADAKREFEARLKAEVDARLKAEVDSRVKAQIEQQARLTPDPALRPTPLRNQAPIVERRVALVIGNSSYRDAPPLTNPKSDAEAVAESLRKIGFQLVMLQLDLTRENFINAIRKFEEEVERSDWAVIYYAGHGMEANSQNYMIPIDAKLRSDRDILDEAVPLGRILTATDRARKLRIVVLDACRNNPFASRMRRSNGFQVNAGLARIEPEGGTLVSFAARDGRVAQDGDGSHSPFTDAFIKTVDTPGLEVNMMFRVVRDKVFAATRKQQEPVTWGSLSGESFYFVDK